MENVTRGFGFLDGLPRAGSTLLCNILNQNPLIHATQTSGCMDVLFGIRNNWHQLIEHRASPKNDALLRVMHAAIMAYYADVQKPIVIDKCRGWLSFIETIEAVMGSPITIIVPVRDIRDVLSSFELLWRRRSKNGQLADEANNYFDFQTIEGRMDYWMRKDQAVGLACNRIRDAINRGYRDRLHFVPFEKLTIQPEETMKALYARIGMEYFQHDFDHVKQVTKEDDAVFGFEDLHVTREKVEPMTPHFPSVLGKAADRYVTANEIWRTE